MLTFFTIGEGFISVMLGYVGNIFDDVKLLILLMAGLFAGFYIVEKIIDVSFRNWYTGGGFEKDPSLTEADKTYFRSKL